MRKSAWYMTFLSAAALAGTVGCGDDVDPCAPGSGMICPVDGGVEDAEVPADTGMRPDRPDTGTSTCGDVGRTGGHCRDGVCFSGLECADELRRTLGELEYFPAMEDPANPQTFVPIAAPTAADDVVLRFATGSMCTEECDTSADADSCGSCAKCSGSIGGDILGFPPAFLFGDFMSEFPAANSGVCRAHCSFDLEGNGMGCPDGFTCDAFTNLCLEACVDDAQCNAAAVLMENGEVGTWINPDGGRTCNVTTGRCDWTGPTEPHVGDVCESQADCREDTGFCLRGGTCVQTQCNRTDIAPGDTQADFTCDGGRGICLGTGGNTGAICIQGCNTPDDCNPGNTCLPLGDTAGSFSGYCFGICDTVPSGGTDEVLTCRADEQCDMPAATAEDMDPDGTCRPSCDPAATPSTCETDEVCEAVTGQTYGFCRALDGICFESDACFNGQICDNEIAASTYGRCVTPCTDAADCTVGTATTCVTDTTSPLAGLCVETCTAAATCGAGRTCRVAVGSTDGYCVDLPPA